MYCTATGAVFNEDSDSALDFRIESDGKTHMFFVDSSTNRIAINNANSGVPSTVLHLKGEADSLPGILVEGYTVNGQILLADDYVAGEYQGVWGVSHSSAAAYMSSKVYGADDANYDAVGGWKSATDAAAYNGSAVVADGGAGTISLYYGASNAVVSPGATKALTRGLHITDIGRVGLGVGTVDTHFHVESTGSDGEYIAKFEHDGGENRHVLWLQGGHDTAGTGTVHYARCADGNGDVVGDLRNSTGTFSAYDTSDIRLKKDIVDTAINGLNVVNGMKIRDFTWKKTGDKCVAGFVANELKDVFPSAVSGEADATWDYEITPAVKAEAEVAEVTEEGKVIVEYKAAVEAVAAVTEERVDPMMVARDTLIPVLVKAVQELSAKVTALENA